MIGLNYTNILSESIGEKGLEKTRIEAMRERAMKAHSDIVTRSRPELEFMDLISQDLTGIKEIAAQVRAEADDFVHLGIGGSALGPKTIIEALSPMHNYRSKPRIFICDNVDPKTLDNILSVIDLKKTTVNAVTKSGSTAETMASFMVLFDRMRDRANKIIATTDPEKGFLRELAGKYNMRTLPVPQAVGGRYSVLCPVGLLPAEVAGISSDDMLRGARDMHARCAEPDIWKNPAYLFGTILYLMDVEEKRNINVLIPYSDRLKPLSEWFCQLWAESLGKLGMGTTPYPATGTTDQHSQLQLWMEGPEDKVIVFIRVEDHGTDVKIPKVFEDSGLGYLCGKSFANLMNAEEESTELCLSKNGRPNMTITLPAIDAYHMGQLFYFFEIATAYAGFLYGVNPFNQPSVEEGKNFTYGMMGRPGYEAKREEVERARLKKDAFKL